MNGACTASAPAGRALDAAGWAALARQFEHGVATLADRIDPGWHALAPWQPLQPLRATLSNPRVQGALFERVCGPWPPLDALASPAATLALRPREQVLARLAAFALLGRLGAVRCNVQRASRAAIAAWLGPAWAPLRELAHGAEAVDAALASRMPLAWAQLGYEELCTQRAWPHRSLRRMVRLALPVRLTRSGLPHGTRAARGTAERLQALEPLFEGRAPW